MALRVRQGRWRPGWRRGSGGGGGAAVEQIFGEIVGFPAGTGGAQALLRFFGFGARVFLVAADGECSVEVAAGIDGEGLGEKFAVDGSLPRDFDVAGAVDVAGDLALISMSSTRTGWRKTTSHRRATKSREHWKLTTILDEFRKVTSPVAQIFPETLPSTRRLRQKTLLAWRDAFRWMKASPWVSIFLRRWERIWTSSRLM